MSVKFKSLIYNFIGFIFFFLLIRMCVGYFFPINNFFNLLIVGLITIIIAPKFAVIKEHNGEKIKMKWIFIKGVKEVE